MAHHHRRNRHARSRGRGPTTTTPPPHTTTIQKIFDYRGAVEVPALIGTMFLFPLVLYAVTKGEMQNSNNTCVNGDRDSKWDVKGNKTAKYM